MDVADNNIVDKRLVHFLMVCFAVGSTHCALNEDIFEIKNDVRALKAEMLAMKRQLQTIIDRLVAPASSSILSRPVTVDSTPQQRDCADIMSHGDKPNGVYTVYVGATKRPVQVYCDMTTDGGGWTVFQRRRDGNVSFYRNWNEYEHGFGDVNGEYWLGNDILHRMTSGRTYRLRVDLGDWYGNTRYAEYSNFKVGPACEKYALMSLGTYCGTAGDSLAYQLGEKFSTFDEDNDSLSGSCAQTHKGAWWYKGCHHSNLNGLYIGGPYDSGGYGYGVAWSAWRGAFYSLKFTEMKFRPVDI